MTGKHTSAVRELTLCALLTALALGISYLENLFPLTWAVPLPGVKPGLANVVTLFALYTLGPSRAGMILFSRCVLASLFAGNVNALLYSLLGGAAAMLAMSLLSRWEKLSVYGVSMGGAAAHNTGQICAAVLTLGSAAPLWYLPFLLLVSLLTGALTGLVAACLFRAMRNTGFMKG